MYSQFLQFLTTLRSTLQEHLALSVLTDEEVRHVNNMFSAEANVNSMLAALDCLAAVIKQQEDDPSRQQDVILSFQVSIMQHENHLGTSCQHRDYLRALMEVPMTHVANKDTFVDRTAAE